MQNQREKPQMLM